MALGPGARIGSFEIVARLGAGGMGEVFRARDLTLKREVALKILPEAWSRPDATSPSASHPGDEQHARFEREAQVLAALNHPNIAQVYGFEEASPETTGLAPTRVLVMELVEGEDLAARIARGPVPQDEAVAIARQIADALSAAHDAGIVHRDLKPANVKLRPDGTAKVLDFGLARLAIEAGGADAGSATITSPALTRQGIVLGTAAYMAPEQARGRPVDRRADLWAFGCVVYEMLTGRRLFQGDTVSDTIADVLRKDVLWSNLPPDTSPALVRLLRQCLQRDPARRLRDAGDVRLLLDAIDDDGMGGGEPRPVTAAPPRRRAAAGLGLAAAAVLIGVAAGWVASRSSAAGDRRPPPVVRFAVTPPDEVGEISNVALAPDGSFLVYEGIVSTGRRLFVRRMDQADSQPLEGTDGGRWPVVSPDGRWVAFFRAGKLQKVAVSGGDSLTLCDANGGPGAAWGPNGRILFAESWTGDEGLMSVSDQGGAPVRVSVTPVGDDSRQRGHWWPAFLPDGRHVLFTAFMSGAGLNDNRVGVLNLETGESRLLFPGARPFWISSGHILFSHAGRYQVVPFDVTTRQTTGNPQPVLEDALQLDPTGDWPQPVAVAPSGAVAYVAGRLVPDSRLAWIGADGTVQPLNVPSRPYVSVSLAPDERRAAVSSLEGGTMRIRLLELERGSEQLLELDGMNWGPAWHPSGDRVAFTSVRKGDLDVYQKLLDTDQREQPLLDGAEDASVVAFTSEALLVTRDSDAQGAYSLVEHHLASSPRSGRPLTGVGVLPGAAISPDARWVAYSVAQGNQREVLVKPLADGGAPGRVVSQGGTQPRFGRRPGELFYRRGSTLVRLSWRAEQGRFAAGDERVVGEFAFGSLPGYPGPYDTSTSGRLLALIRTAPPTPPAVQIVLEWPRTLPRPLTGSR